MNNSLPFPNNVDTYWKGITLEPNAHYLKYQHFKCYQMLRIYNFCHKYWFSITRKINKKKKSQICHHSWENLKVGVEGAKPDNRKAFIIMEQSSPSLGKLWALKKLKELFCTIFYILFSPVLRVGGGWGVWPLVALWKDKSCTSKKS